MKNQVGFIVQHAGAAFGNVRDIHNWQKLNVFASLDDAKAEVSELTREMKERCGTCAWDDHFRVIPTEDTRITYEYMCLGPILVHGTCHVTARVTVGWPAGEVRPYDGDCLPSGWSALSTCGDCAETDRIAIETQETPVNRTSVL